MIFQIRQTINIKKDNPVLEYKQGLDYGNNLAHEWLVFVEEDGELVDLASVAVTGYFLREDGVTVKVDGSVKNGACSVVFDRRCYLVEGAVKCAMVLTRGAEVVTSAKLRTNANQNITDQIIDTGDTIPTDIYDLLTQIDAMREATAATVAATVEANAAAARANAGAERAEQLQIDASGLAGDSNMLGGKPPSYYLPVENLLVNSNWRNVAKIVNQRGSQLYTRPEYSIDRWVIYTLDGVGAPSLNIATGHVRLGENTYLQQRFPIGFYDNAKLYTVALWYADGGLSVSPITLNRSAEEEFDYFDIFPEPKRDISAVAVYEGTYTADTLPPYVPKENEIVSCLQYAYIPMNSQFAIPVSLGGYTSITFPFRMRAIPTVELENLNGVPVEIVEQNEYGVAVINNAERTAQFRVKAFVDL